MNFVAQRHIQFIDNPELNPLACAEQYADPDPVKALPADELLRQARLILVTELGKDPLLRNHVRQTYKDEAVVSVVPTERGKVKIDEHHPYFVRNCVGLCLHCLTRFLLELQIFAEQTYSYDDNHITIPARTGRRKRESCLCLYLFTIRRTVCFGTAFV